MRYHLRRAAEAAGDGRRANVFKAAAWAHPIEACAATHGREERLPNVAELCEVLVAWTGYAGSYQLVRRHMRQRWGQPRMPTYRRVEALPGAQAQTDWRKYPSLNVGDGPEPLNVLVMVLSLEELQHDTNERIERWSRRARCLATGLSVQESWEEREKLAPLPLLPEPFDVSFERPMHILTAVSEQKSGHSSGV